MGRGVALLLLLVACVALAQEVPCGGPVLAAPELWREAAAPEHPDLADAPIDEHPDLATPDILQDGTEREGGTCISPVELSSVSDELQALRTAAEALQQQVARSEAEHREELTAMTSERDAAATAFHECRAASAGTASELGMCKGRYFKAEAFARRLQGELVGVRDEAESCAAAADSLRSRARAAEAGQFRLARRARELEAAAAEAEARAGEARREATGAAALRAALEAAEARLAATREDLSGAREALRVSLEALSARREYESLLEARATAWLPYWAQRRIQAAAEWSGDGVALACDRLRAAVATARAAVDARLGGLRDAVVAGLAARRDAVAAGLAARRDAASAALAASRQTVHTKLADLDALARARADLVRTWADERREDALAVAVRPIRAARARLDAPLAAAARAWARADRARANASRALAEAHASLLGALAAARARLASFWEGAVAGTAAASARAAPRSRFATAEGAEQLLRALVLLLLAPLAYLALRVLVYLLRPPSFLVFPPHTDVFEGLLLSRQATTDAASEAREALRGGGRATGPLAWRGEAAIRLAVAAWAAGQPSAEQLERATCEAADDGTLAFAASRLGLDPLVLPGPGRRSRRVLSRARATLARALLGSVVCEGTLADVALAVAALDLGIPGRTDAAAAAEEDAGELAAPDEGAGELGDDGRASPASAIGPGGAASQDDGDERGPATPREAAPGVARETAGGEGGPGGPDGWGGEGDARADNAELDVDQAPERPREAPLAFRNELAAEVEPGTPPAVEKEVSEETEREPGPQPSSPGEADSADEDGSVAEVD